MGPEVEENLPYQYSFKLHYAMCSKLLKLVETIRSILPEIEAARPRSSYGMDALCLLNQKAMAKADQILQYCCDSSKLYLAFTGDAILARCQRARNLLVDSLCQVQSVLPETLASKISGIIDDLEAATFTLDPSERAAGKVIRDLLLLATSESELLKIKTLEIAASRLLLTSPKAILIEKRSIKRLLDKIGDSDCNKKKMLTYLLYMLKKYEKTIKVEQTEDLAAEHVPTSAPASSTSGYTYYERHKKQGGRSTNLQGRAVIPEKYRCPISTRLMYDPVDIASGQTFERVWIQKWFDDGNNTCPRTKIILPHRSLTPNTTLKDLISKWCLKFGLTVTEPSTQASDSVDASLNSIASFGSSINDLHIPLDISHISIGSSDNGYNSLESVQSLSGKVRDLDVLLRIAEFRWDSQRKVVEDLSSCLQSGDKACHSFSLGKILRPLLQFLGDAHTRQDRAAREAGSQLLLALVSGNRYDEEFYNYEGLFSLLELFIDSPVIKDVLVAFEALSSHPHCKPKFMASGSLTSLLNILGTQSEELQEIAIKTLKNLSTNIDCCSEMVALGCIPKMVHLINDSELSGHCLTLMENLCTTKEARVSVTETSGCIASISEVLENGSQEDQEHAVAILLLLCCHCMQFARLVMDEGVNIIPSLVYVSNNGNDKGKAGALELIRQLRDVKYEKEQECVEPDPELCCSSPREGYVNYKNEQDRMGPDTDLFCNYPRERNSSSNTTGILQKTFFKSIASKAKSFSFFR